MKNNTRKKQTKQFNNVIQFPLGAPDEFRGNVRDVNWCDFKEYLTENNHVCICQAKGDQIGAIEDGDLFIINYDLRPKKTDIVVSTRNIVVYYDGKVETTGVITHVIKNIVGGAK